eukprot:3556164-Pyramimonas_sp.AAC.1
MDSRVFCWATGLCCFVGPCKEATFPEPRVCDAAWTAGTIIAWAANAARSTEAARRVKRKTGASL